MNYYLAIDVGASSGRHILGSIQNGKIVLEEVYRFENKNIKRDGHLVWELDKLFENIKAGMKKCAEIGKKPVSMGIDFFGVDFVLLDKDDNILGDTIAYRDSRTNGMPEEIDKIIPREKLYERTGIQSQLFNTIYQLYSVKKTSDYLDKAERWLMLAEYFNFLLTGVKMNEYTNCSTTGLLNAKTHDFDKELLDMLGIPSKIFGTPQKPGTVVGKLTPEISAETGLDLTVVLPATHDTGSAVMSVPTMDPCVYISSGTWSLMGVLLNEAITTDESRESGFTNEGAYDGGIRYLKNIMGLWIIQSIRRDLNKKYTFDEMCEMAQNSNYTGEIDVNDNCFLAPDNMVDAIKNYLAEHNQPAPESIDDILCTAYNSLAKEYARTVSEIENITGKTYDRIHIVGGGCKDTFLSELTAKYTGKAVYAGPVEATALGNILCQMFRGGEYADMKSAKEAIKTSFDVKRI